MKPIIVFGAGGQAKVVIEAIEAQGTHRIVGVISERAPDFRSSYPVVGRDADLAELWTTMGPFDAHVAIGDNRLRRQIVERATAAVPALAFAAVVHPMARLAKGATIDAGAFVAIGATVCADAHVGPHAVVNTNASIDHDCALGAYATVAPNAALGGTVRLGAGAFVGIGASVLPNLTIGDGAVVGAGAVVVRDVPALETVVGVPAGPRQR